MEIQLVIFKLDQKFYGISVFETKEIIRMVEITPVPQTDYYVEGIVNLRGKVTPVLNLNKRLGLPEKEYDQNTRIIVIEKVNKEVGLIIDAVVEVKTIKEEDIEPLNTIDEKVEYLRGVIKLGEELLLLLDLNYVINEDDLSIEQSA